MPRFIALVAFIEELKPLPLDEAHLLSPLATVFTRGSYASF
ncbi:hypothetical protein [Bradyrhizobium lablabi]|nr:hypothetical protein [Bradyrhizobium lablabi]